MLNDVIEVVTHAGERCIYEVITSVKKFEYFRIISPGLEEVYSDIYHRILFSDFSQAIPTKKTCLGKCLELLLNFVCSIWSSVK